MIEESTARTGKISLEPVVASDAEALVEIRIAAMRESLEALGRFDPARARNRFLESFVPAHTRHIDFNRQRAGFVVVKANDNALQLDHLYVLPAFQGNGIGTTVLKMVFAEADDQSLPLHVGALRESASNRFYLRHGFVKTDESEWDNYYVRMPLARNCADAGSG